MPEGGVESLSLPAMGTRKFWSRIGKIHTAQVYRTGEFVSSVGKVGRRGQSI